MKKHASLEELLEDFTNKIQISSKNRVKTLTSIFIKDYASSNSLASTEQIPLAKNKQFDNSCVECDGLGMVEVTDYAPCNNCFGSGDKQE